MPLSDRVVAGDPRAIARAISLIENDASGAAELIRRIFAHTGRAHLIGITGPPGAGKSTLVDRLIAALRRRGRTVGVLAVDPTSPFTGGALLGDRVRMGTHAGDDGVFIRSMATRGHLGGLARATADAALVLDAAGRDTVVIETVGVGQDEVDIVRTADVSVVTLVPGAGDDVQALKAGVMEIGDVFVVNKADREGADRTAASVEAMLSLRSFRDGEWRPPVLRTEATTGRGVEELLDAIERFRTRPIDARRRRARAGFRIRELIAEAVVRHVEARVLLPGELDETLGRVATRETDPYSVVDDIVRRTLAAGRGRGKEARGVEARLDHVGIAVADIGEALAFYRDALGLDVDVPEDVPSQRVRAHFIRSGGAALELLEATAADSPIARFVAKRGPGLHHVTLCVDDLAAALERLKARGVRLVDDAPRQGADGALVVFIHPSSTHGVLVELKQAATGPDVPAGGTD